MPTNSELTRRALMLGLAAAARARRARPAGAGGRDGAGRRRW